MGARVSKDKSTSNVMNEFVTDVITNVTNEKKTVVEVNQKMDIGCEDDVYKEVSRLCELATERKEKTKETVLTAYVNAGKELSPELLASLDATPPVCDACSAENIDQNSMLTISMTDVQDNSIAGKIQDGIAAKLDETKKNMQNEGFGKSEITDESIKNITNKVKSSVVTDIINKSLTSFVVNQDMKIGNTKARNVSQKSIVSFIASNMIENVVESDKSLKADIESLMGSETTQKSMQSNTTDMITSVGNNLISTVGSVAKTGLGVAGGAAMMWIVMIIVAIVVFGLIAKPLFGMFLGAGGQLPGMPNMQQQDQLQMQYAEPYDPNMQNYNQQQLFMPNLQPM